MAEGAGEVEIFIAAREREQIRTLSSQTPFQSPNLYQAPSLLVKLLCLWGPVTWGSRAAQPSWICRGVLQENDSIWIALPSFRLHAGPGVLLPSIGNQPCGIPLTASSQPIRCPPARAHAQARRVQDENDICRHECQHTGVPVARDRCLTEEVREGPGFPGCLLCSPPIAQRNTLSAEQREKGKGGAEGPEGAVGGADRLFPQALDAGTLQRPEDFQMNSPSTHPSGLRELHTKGHLPPPHLLPLCICRGAQSLATGQALDLGSGHLSPHLHQQALVGGGRDANAASPGEPT